VPLIHRRFTRSLLLSQKLTRYPRAMPLGFEAFICARPRSTSPVIHLARARSPLQFRLLQAPSSLDVGAVLLSTFRS
jgi:hypothetical protein